eukprot:TRINITY_DN6335_c0_g1_i1.p2 TRINITY_DN6335_c0_g1~~TRINITY_DN6335_c0_g1_i1.p2  ORF type:complete len:132 (+),score=46.75 TRINITY_DN6335_c0_g1_i1:252-647(+)
MEQRITATATATTATTTTTTTAATAVVGAAVVAFQACTKGKETLSEIMEAPASKIAAAGTARTTNNKQSTTNNKRQPTTTTTTTTTTATTSTTTITTMHMHKTCGDASFAAVCKKPLVMKMADDCHSQRLL